MRDYKLHKQEYLDYLKFLQKEIYKHLPLYEDGDFEAFLKYVDKSIRKVIIVKEIVNPLPHSYWYVDVLTNLIEMERIVVIGEDSHSEIKKLVFDSTNMIKFQIKYLQGGE